MTPDAEPRLKEAMAHAQFVRAVARGVLGGDADVEDVLQETFLVAWERGPRKPGALRAWLGTVAKRLALDRVRAMGRRRRREAGAARAEALPSVVTMAGREETRQRLMEAVLALEEPYRSTLLWRYHAGLSLAEIAERQYVPEETVRTRVQRGLARLRDRLDREHPGGRAAWSAALFPLATGTEGGAMPVGRLRVPRGVGVSTLATAGGIVGGLAVKKVAIAVVVVALLAVGAVAVVRATGSRSVAAPDEVPPKLAAGAPGGRAPEAPSLAASGKTSPTSETEKPAPSVAEAAQGRLHVRVVGPDGRAIEGATVTIAPGVDRLPFEAYAQQQLGTKSATTDATGVVFDAPVGRHAIQVRAAGFRPIDLEPVEVAANLQAEREARLDEGIVVNLRVLDDEKKGPVSHAKVYVGGPLASVAEGLTDAEGRCTLRGIAPPTPEMLRAADPYLRRIFLRVLAEGFVTLDWSTDCPRVVEALPLDVSLRRGTTVRVRVSTTDGSVPDEVQVSAPIPHPSANPIGYEYPVVGPGPDGWAVLPPLSPGRHRIEVSAGGGAVRYQGVSKEVDVGTTPIDLEVALEPFTDARIEGRVLLPDGSPAPVLGVVFVPGHEESSGWSTPKAAAEGRFALEHLQAGPGELRIYVPGFLRQSFPVEVLARGGSPLTLTLKDGVRMQGRVVDRDGHPVGGVTVTAWKPITYANGSKSSTSLGEMTPGDDGRFSLVVGDTAAVHLQVQSERWLPTLTRTTEDLTTAETEVTLVVKPAAEGSGLPLVIRLVEPRGKPIEESVTIQWKSAGDTRGATQSAVLPEGRLRFSFWGEPGSYDIDVFVPGYRVAHLRTVPIEDTATPVTHDVALDLGGILRLRVLDADGRPRARHRFQVGERARLLTTDEAGGVELTGSEPGPVAHVPVVDTEDTTGRVNGMLKRIQAPGAYDVVVQRSGYVLAKLPWRYDTIPEGAVAELLDASGRVVDREDLVRYPGSGNQRPAMTYLRVVADGPYTIRVTAGTVRLTGTVDARVGADVDAPIGP